MGEFYGSLQDIGLPEILSFLKGLGKTGSLRVSHGRWVGDVSMSGGRVDAASFNNEQGVTALEAMMLGLPGGSFTFTDGPPSTAPNVDLEPDALHARLSAFDEERASLSAIIPSLSAIPRVAKAPSTTGEVVLDGGAIETLLAVNGETSVGEIAREHGLIPTAKELAKLVQNGLITIDAPEGDAAAARSESAEAVAPAGPHADVASAPVPSRPTE